MSTLPSPEEFFLKVPIYKPYAVSEENIEEIFKIICYKGTLDMYCSKCKNSSTFKSTIGNLTEYANYVNAEASPGSLRESNETVLWLGRLSEARNFYVGFKCTRECGQVADFYIQVIGGKLIKAGQYPSTYDLTKSSIKQYDKILDSGFVEEFDKALRLASSGVGIGSFVYLRRIFESLIEEAHVKAAVSKDWQEDTYQKSRMADRIELLKGQLPSFLVENKTMYSILSKGIHELSEDECLKSFEALKLGIELILDERKEIMERDKKIYEAKKAIQKIHEGMK